MLRGQRLFRRLAAHDRRWLAVAFASVAFAAALAGFAATVAAGLTQATVDTVEGINAGMPARGLLKSGSELPGAAVADGAVVPVQFGAGSVRSAAALIEAEFVFTATPVDYGARVSGRAPTNRSEVAVSVAAANGLGIDIGDSVELGNTDRVVVGTFALPMFGDLQTVHGIDSLGAPTDIFLRDAGALDQTTVQVRSTESLIAQRVLDASIASERLRQVWFPVSLVLYLAVAGWVANRWSRRQESSVAALRYAGIGTTKAHRALVRPFGFVVACAGILGLLAGWLTVRVGTETISHSLGQHWVSVPVPWVALVQAFAAALVVVLLMAGIRWPIAEIPVIAGPLVVIVCLVVALGGALLYILAPSSLAISVLSIVALSLALLCLAVGGASGFASGSAQVSARWFAGRRRAFALPVLVCSTVMFLGALLSGYWGLLAWEERNGYQPAFDFMPSGSIQIESIGEDGATAITDRFVQLGGEHRTFARVAESATLPRATTAHIARCLAAQVPVHASSIQACAADGPLALGLILADAHGAVDTEVRAQVYAQPAMIDSSGQIGLIRIDDTTDAVIEAAVVDAVPSQTLSTMNGVALVPVGSDAYGAFGLAPNGTYTVALLAASDVSDGQLAELRFLIDNHAASSVVNEDPGPRDGTLRQASIAIAILGVVSSLALWFVLGGLARVSDASANVFERIAARRPSEVRGLWLPLAAALAVGPVAAGLLLARLSEAPLPRVMFISLAVPVVVVVMGSFRDQRRSVART